MVAGLLNPAIPSTGEITPKTTRDPMISSAMRSTESLSIMNNTIAPKITAAVM